LAERWREIQSFYGCDKQKPCYSPAKQSSRTGPEATINSQPAAGTLHLAYLLGFFNPWLPQWKL